MAVMDVTKLKEKSENLLYERVKIFCRTQLHAEGACNGIMPCLFGISQGVLEDSGLVWFILPAIERSLAKVADQSERTQNDEKVNGRDGEVVSLDIIPGILDRLPVKSLLRFKCVSKPWRSIISDPSFAGSVLARSLARPAVTSLVCISDLCQLVPSPCQFFRLDHQTGLSAPVPPPDMPSELHVKIFESIHGFFCLNHRDVTRVCNPGTREVAALPLTDPGFPADLQGEIDSFAALGYDPASKQYKVLKTWILSTRYGDVVAAHKVLTLGTNSWRRVDDCPIKLPWDDCISAPGAIHILTHDSIENIVVTFDVASEKLRILLPPGGALARTSRVDLKLFREHLALLECGRLWDDDKMTMYVLDDDHGSQAWKELRMVLPHSWKEGTGLRKLLGTSIPCNGDGDILLIPMLIHGQSQAYLISYNEESKSMKKVQIHGPSFHQLQQFLAALLLNCKPFDFVDNISSLNHLNS